MEETSIGRGMHRNAFSVTFDEEVDKLEGGRLISQKGLFAKGFKVM